MMNVNSIERLPALDAILYTRPAGRNIIDFAIEEIERLRKKANHEELLSRHAEARKQAEELALLRSSARQKQADIVSLAQDLGSHKVEIERLSKLATRRGARMQIMREWMIAGTRRVWDLFEHHNPEAAEWFDEDGVPK